MSTNIQDRSRALFLALTTCSILLTPVQSMELDERIKQTSPIGLNSSLTFRSADEMIAYGRNVLDQSNKHQFENVITLASKQFCFDFKVDNFSELHERFSYFMNHSLGQAYTHFGYQSVLKPDISMNHFLIALAHEEKYITEFRNCPPFNEWVLPHRVVVLKSASDICIKLAEFCYTSDVHTNMQINQYVTGQLKKSVTYLFEALSYKNMSQNFEADYFIMIQNSLFNSYINLIPVCLNPEEKKSLITKAKELMRDVKKQSHKDALSQAQHMEQKFALIDCLEERTRVGKKIGGSKQIRQKRVQNFQEIDARLHDLENAVNAQITPSTSIRSISKPQIISDCNQIQALANNHQAPKARDHIKALEHKISVVLSQSKEGITLSDIYEQICVFVGLKDLLGLRNSIMMAGIESGNMKEALERVILLTDLELKKQGNVSTLTRWLQASLKSLCGDSTEWIALEEEWNQEALSKKKAVQEKNVRLVKAGIEQSRQATSEKKTLYKTVGTQQTSQSPDIPQENDLMLLPKGITKEEKIRKHEEAEKKRAEKKLALDVPEVLTPQTVATPKPELKEDRKLPKISELYTLTKRAKKVDNQIENGTWKFTRQHLITYLEVLGCQPEEGGKHKKVPLPPAIKIMHNGTLISVINDLGGALTLPRWDKSTNNGCVPDYLIDQILEAREKLVLLALKALK